MGEHFVMHIKDFSIERPIMQQDSSPIDILLVEDSPGDIELTRLALSNDEIPSRLFVVTDGEKTLEFLRCEGEYSDTAMPNIIILDLDIQKQGGIEVLKFIKSEPKFRSIPVVVLTSSATESDIAAVYSLHANCCLKKPAELSEFKQMIAMIKKFWLSNARLPGRGENKISTDI